MSSSSSTTRARRRSRTGALVLGLLLAVLVLPPAAGAATTTSISLFSDDGDFIGGGLQRVFHPGNTSQLGAKVERDELIVFAVGGPYAEGYSFSFAAPPGETLQTRNYVDAQRLSFRDPGHAGLDVTGEARGCNELTGRFEVRQLELDAQGQVARLWIVFQQHCEHAFAAAHGEIRINAWVPGEQATVAPGIVRWAPLDTWREVSPVTVTYRGSSPVAQVAVDGAHAGDVAVDAGGCADRAGPCDLGVRFDPRGAGARSATLRITDAAGAVHAVALEGFEHGGATGADLEVLPGDVASTQQGRYVYTPANARFSGTVYDHEAALVLESRDGASFWRGNFHTGPALLAPGSFTAPTASPSGGPALDVYGRQAGCTPVGGEFTVHEVSRMPDGSTRSFDVSFLQRCYQDRREALRGRWRYRAGDTAAVPAWLVAGPRDRIDAPPLEGPATPPPDDTQVAQDEQAGDPAPDGQSGSAPSGTALGGAASTSLGAAVPTPAAASVVPPAVLGRRVLLAACPAAVARVARTLAGTAAADRLRGTARADLLLGGRGDDRLSGAGGRDCLAGDAGRDRLDGGAGDDVLLGGAGDDVLIGGPGRDVLDCGSGRHDRAVATRGDRTRRCESVRAPRR